MEVKITKDILSIQRLHCAQPPGTMNDDNWMRHFLGRILHLSHSQWIFQNITLHDRSRVILKLQRRREILLKVDRLMEVDKTELPQESQFLLEMYFNSLIRSPIDKQSYWVRAMKAAWKAGRRDRAKEGRMGAREKRRAANQKTP